MNDRDLKPRHPLPLLQNEVHVWTTFVDRWTSELGSMVSLLSANEQARSERFFLDRDRQRYLIGRSGLRILLSQYLRIKPSEVWLEYTPYGKPVIRDASGQASIQFNLSHSENIIVYAVSSGRRVGIDVEKIQSKINEDRFADHFFSARERELIHSLSGKPKQEAFFKIWTCKEAYLKARGDGLCGSIDQIEILLEDGKEARLGSINGDETLAGAWRLAAYTPALDYQASLAVEGHDWGLVYRQIEEVFMDSEQS